MKNKINKAYHQIADITFYSEWNSWLPVIKAVNFIEFETKKKPPDIKNKIFFINNTEDVYIPSKNEINKILQYSKFNDFCRETPLLKNFIVIKNVLSQINKCRKKNNLELIIAWNLIIVKNYLKRELELYYSEDFGSYFEKFKSTLAQNFVAANFCQIFSSFLPFYNAAIFHSSGIILNKRAAIFLAPDGGGKTTVLSNSNKKMILSEDQIICRKKGNQFYAYSTPLGGMNSGSFRAILGGIFLLQKAKTFYLKPLKRKDFLLYVWNEQYNYTNLYSKNYRKKSFKIICDMAKNIPIYQMGFKKNYVDWDSIKQIVGKH